MSRSRTSSKTRTQSSARQNAKELQSPAAFFSANRRNAALSAVLAAATIALYVPATGHSFLILDDREYVTANPHVHDGLSWSTIKWAFTSTEAANWHPLTWLSHALDYQLFALNPAGHHFDNVFIHALNAVLLFLLLQWVTKRAGPSLLTAALFALHPLNVESVAWIAERKNVLSTFFLLLTIFAYAWYAQRPNWRRYLLAAALFFAGLMAKPMLVTLPFALLLLDYWPLKRISFDQQAAHAPRISFAFLLLEKLPLLFLSAVSCWMTLKAQHSVVHTFEEYSFASRVENALAAYGLYLWKTVWPARLAFYPHSIFALPAWQWILSALVLIAITAAVIVFRTRRYLPVGWFWFLGTLIPVIGLVQVGEQALADRYAYVPLIGIFLMISFGLADLADAKHIPTVWRVIPSLLVLCALCVVTHAQIAYWESDYDLWAHTLALETLALEETPFTHNALGNALMNPDSAMTAHDLDDFNSPQGRMDEARRHFERALELRRPLAEKNPDSSRWDLARTLNNLGNLDRMENRLDEARAHDEAALKLYRQLAQVNPDAYLPYLAAILSNLGAMDRLQNRLDQSRQNYAEALQIDRGLVDQAPAKYLPNTAMVLSEFGLLDEAQNRWQDAHDHYGESLRIARRLAQQSPAVYRPQLAQTLENFGMLDALQSHLDDARRHFEEALQIDQQLAADQPGESGRHAKSIRRVAHSLSGSPGSAAQAGARRQPLRRRRR
jgi:tetratricopeptide (TPR) repeat protein